MTAVPAAWLSHSRHSERSVAESKNLSGVQEDPSTPLHSAQGDRCGQSRDFAAALAGRRQASRRQAGSRQAGSLSAAQLARRAARRAVLQIALALLLAANARSLLYYYTNYEKEPWDQAAQYVSQHARPGDLILFNASWVQLPFDFYFHPPVDVVEHGLPVDLFDRSILEPKMSEQDLPRLQALLQGRTRVWLVYSHNWYTDPQGLIPAALAQHGRLAESKHLRGIEIQRYTANTTSGRVPTGRSALAERNETKSRADPLPACWSPR